MTEDEHDVPVRLYTFDRGKRREWAFRIGALEGYDVTPDGAIRHALEGITIEDIERLRKSAKPTSGNQIIVLRERLAMLANHSRAPEWVREYARAALDVTATPSPTTN